MPKKENINVQGTAIAILAGQKDDYISLTDMAKYKNAKIPGTVVGYSSISCVRLRCGVRVSSHKISTTFLLIFSTAAASLLNSVY